MTITGPEERVQWLMCIAWPSWPDNYLTQKNESAYLNGTGFAGQSCTRFEVPLSYSFFGQPLARMPEWPPWLCVVTQYSAALHTAPKGSELAGIDVEADSGDKALTKRSLIRGQTWAEFTADRQGAPACVFTYVGRIRPS